MSKPKAAGPDDLPIMQDDRIHWNGQPVAIVLAETQEQADHAQTLIRVTYEEQNPVISLAAAKAKGTEPGLFMGEPLKQKVGDAEAALAAAPHKVDVTYTTPRHHHSSDRAARLHPRLGGRRRCESTTPRRRWRTKPGRSRRCSGWRRSRCASPRPSLAAASAASSFGSTRFWRRRRRSSQAGRCGSCSRARGCFVSSAAAPSPSSAWRSAPRPTAGSTP